MITPDAVASGALDALQLRVAGKVILAGDPGYDEARLAWNLAADQRPALIVLAESAADVQETVRFARSSAMRLAPQATGHGAMALESLDGALLLKTSLMRQVDIDPVRRTARAEAGAQWQDVTLPASEHGLAALAGTSPNVGVIGYTLGGGLGWLARRYGLAANSVTAVEMVTPDGRLVRVDADHEPDLFWAARGGGGSTGVVTALEMALYPVREIYAGALSFPIQRSSEVLHAWREWTETVPDDVTSIGRILRLPPLPDIPEFLRGRNFVLVEAAVLGDPGRAADLIGPLRELGPELDTFATIPAPGLARVNMDPEQSVPAEGDGVLLAEAPAAAIDRLVALAGPDADTSLLSVEVRHLGGALARPAPGGGALPKIDARYAVFAVGFTPVPGLGAAVRADARALKVALSTWRARYDYYNFVETPAQADVAFPRATYQRLQQIKGRYDPDQMIISAHPVRPVGQ